MPERGTRDQAKRGLVIDWRARADLTLGDPKICQGERMYTNKTQGPNADRPFWDPGFDPTSPERLTWAFSVAERSTLLRSDADPEGPRCVNPVEDT